MASKQLQNVYFATRPSVGGEPKFAAQLFGKEADWEPVTLMNVVGDWRIARRKHYHPDYSNLGFRIYVLHARR
jgi:hypothetical protein